MEFKKHFLSYIIKKNHYSSYESARDWIRTSMPVRAHGPEPCASTNSATRALVNALGLEFYLINLIS